MSSDHDFRRAIEEIKLRAPIQDIVGETVDLKSKGRVLWGCCPFHEERTPSFKVDPAAGTWYCFGACRKGGDVIAFVQERGAMTFMDALELLSAQTGVELPRRKPRRTRGNDPGLAALAFAEQAFRTALAGPEGRAARDYLAGRGFGENAIEAFGLGWAPRSGRALIAAAEGEGIAAQALVDTGLARRSDRGGGELYSFFRGRLMIPIRDERGTTIAFGGRLVGDEDGPKYVNTGETRYFHKGRVIYALDRALDAVRRGGHLVLVEGLHRRDRRPRGGAGPRGGRARDGHNGDARGPGAPGGGPSGSAWCSTGTRPGGGPRGVGSRGSCPGHDPRGGGAARGHGPGGPGVGARRGGGPGGAHRVGGPLGRIHRDCVAAKSTEGGRALALEVDRALELFRRLPRPVEIDAAVVALASRLGIPAETLREQFRALKDHGRRRGPGGPAPNGGGPTETSHPRQAPGESSVRGKRIPQIASLDRRTRTAYGSLVGAALLDSGLIPRLRPWIEPCPAPDLARIFQVLVDLWENEGSDITPDLVMNALGDDPARNIVAGISEHARTADDPVRLFEGAVEFLESHEHRTEIARLTALIRDLDSQLRADPTVGPALDEAMAQLVELQRKVATPDRTH